LPKRPQTKGRKPAPKPPRPAVTPVDDDAPAPRRQSLPVRILKRIGLALLVVLALTFAYIFLLLGEPDDEVKYLPEETPEERILVSMNALDMPGATDPGRLAEAFEQPVLVLEQGAAMYKTRIYDTAFENEFARCVAITYTLEDGTQLLVESIRPTAAVSLVKKQDYKLDASALYTMGGLNAARMQNDAYVCVFAQSDTAVYAVTCPVSHAEELPDLLRYTTLAAPEAAD